MNQNLVTQTTALTEAPPPGTWGPQDTSSKDMLLPSILLMHEISDLVKKEQARAGSIVNSVSGNKLADRGESVEIIPILTFREWEISELVEVKGGKTKEEFVRRERMNAQNEEAPFEFHFEGKPHRRTRTIVCFVLVAGETSDLPYLLRFKKSNLYAGKKLSTHFQISGMKNQAPAGQVFGLKGEQQTSNDFTYFAFNLAPTRPATTEEISAAYKWYKVLSSHDVKVVEAETDDFNPSNFGA